MGSETAVDSLSRRLQLAVAPEADKDLTGSACELWATSRQTFTKGPWWPRDLRVYCGHLNLAFVFHSHLLPK